MIKQKVRRVRNFLTRKRQKQVTHIDLPLTNNVPIKVKQDAKQETKQDAKQDAKQHEKQHEKQDANTRSNSRSKTRSKARSNSRSNSISNSRSKPQTKKNIYKDFLEEFILYNTRIPNSILKEFLDELDLTTLNNTQTSHIIFNKLMELLKTKTKLRKITWLIPKSDEIVKNNPYLRDELLLPIIKEMKIINLKKQNN